MILEDHWIIELSLPLNSEIEYKYFTGDGITLSDIVWESDYYRKRKIQNKDGEIFQDFWNQTSQFGQHVDMKNDLRSFSLLEHLSSNSFYSSTNSTSSNRSFDESTSYCSFEQKVSSPELSMDHTVPSSTLSLTSVIYDASSINSYSSSSITWNTISKVTSSDERATDTGPHQMTYNRFKSHKKPIELGIFLKKPQQVLQARDTFELDLKSFPPLDEIKDDVDELLQRANDFLISTKVDELSIPSNSITSSTDLSSLPKKRRSLRTLARNTAFKNALDLSSLVNNLNNATVSKEDLESVLFIMFIDEMGTQSTKYLAKQDTKLQMTTSIQDAMSMSPSVCKRIHELCLWSDAEKEGLFSL